MKKKLLIIIGFISILMALEVQAKIVEKEFVVGEITDAKLNEFIDDVIIPIAQQAGFESKYDMISISSIRIWDDEKGLITRIPARIMKSREGAMSYLRGAFLAGGSVNNPETSRYHLEIYSTYEDHNLDLAKLMNQYFYLNAKTTKRRRGYITYLKEAEKIGDFLHIIGALNAMLSFEDLRIMRDMRNSVNRLVNCDTANMKKTATAAAKQVEDIQ